MSKNMILIMKLKDLELVLTSTEIMNITIVLEKILLKCVKKTGE